MFATFSRVSLRAGAHADFPSATSSKMTAETTGTHRAQRVNQPFRVAGLHPTASISFCVGIQLAMRSFAVGHLVQQRLEQFYRRRFGYDV